jgi:hypothetical protein
VQHHTLYMVTNRLAGLTCWEIFWNCNSTAKEPTGHSNHVPLRASLFKADLVQSDISAGSGTDTHHIPTVEKITGGLGCIVHLSWVFLHHGLPNPIPDSQPAHNFPSPTVINLTGGRSFDPETLQFPREQYQLVRPVRVATEAN